MTHIERKSIGRNAPKPVRYQVFTDPLVALALELEWYFNRGAVISPVHGEQYSYVIMQRDYPAWELPVLTIRLVGMDEMDTERIVPVIVDELDSFDKAV